MEISRHLQAMGCFNNLCTKGLRAVSGEHYSMKS